MTVFGQISEFGEQNEIRPPMVEEAAQVARHVEGTNWCRRRAAGAGREGGRGPRAGGDEHREPHWVSRSTAAGARASRRRSRHAPRRDGRRPRPARKARRSPRRAPLLEALAPPPVRAGPARPAPAASCRSDRPGSAEGQRCHRSARSRFRARSGSGCPARAGIARADEGVGALVHPVEFDLDGAPRRSRAASSASRAT